MKRIRNLLAGVCATICCVAAYEVPVSDTDYSAQVCSGMWEGQNTYINGVSLLRTIRALINHLPVVFSLL